jgi:hypothetical protein
LTIALPIWLGPLILLLVSGAAFWKGGSEERYVAAGILLSFAVTVFTRHNRWEHVESAVFVADISLFIALVVISLKTPKFWPMAAAGFQLLAIMTHVAKVMDAGLQQWAYVTAGVIWTYLLLAALGVGVWNTWRNASQPTDAEIRAGTRR